MGDEEEKQKTDWQSEMTMFLVTEVTIMCTFLSELADAILTLRLSVN